MTWLPDADSVAGTHYPARVAGLRCCRECRRILTPQHGGEHFCIPFWTPLRQLRAEAVKRDGWICGLCRHSITPGLAADNLWRLSLDHRIAQAAGGAHQLDNVQPAHFICNSERGDLPLEAIDPPIFRLRMETRAAEIAERAERRRQTASVEMELAQAKKRRAARRAQRARRRARQTVGALVPISDGIPA